MTQEKNRSATKQLFSRFPICFLFTASAPLPQAVRTRLPAAADCRLRAAGFHLRAAAFRPQAAGFHPRAADFRLPAADFRPRAADFRPQAAAFRLPAAAFRLPAAVFHPRAAAAVRTYLWVSVPLSGAGQD